MKSFILFLIIIIVSVSFIGCSDNNSKITTTKNTNENNNNEQISEENNEEKVKPKIDISNKEKHKLNDAFSRYIYSYEDDLEKINWYYSRGSVGTEHKFAFYIYMGEKNDKHWLRLKTGFYKDDWVFFEKVKVLADDYVFKIPFNEYDDKLEEVQKGIHEFIDVSVDESMIENLIKVANSDFAKIRFVGKNHSKEYEINIAQKKKIKQIIDLYNFKKGNYEGLVEEYIDKEYSFYKPLVGYWKTSAVLSAYKPEDKGDPTNKIHVYRSYDENDNMIEIRIDTIGDWIDEKDYHVLNNKKVELITSNNYKFSLEDYSFKDDNLVIYSYAHRERFIFEKISKEEFEKIYNKAKEKDYNK